ncbi:hypothetical protein C900_05473 [Fulvivirga imtechensis AK7]|uniref:Uncharacterized protein n=1 Tax=Fulvivirga imtechensis AK7 TaxID=1237149 RepID=L8JNH5_9BACT|nr:hypothetical protein [Fulvivirga imtechensis]ELR69084.1 hypothetical protein C900_05473 [Fulvivirga imtechensis AK7]
MIIAKPKIGTLFSLGVFILASLAVATITGYYMINASEITWYQYVIVLVLYPLGFGLAAKVIFGYKIVEVGKEKIDIRFPTRFTKRGYKLRDIDFWKETQVKAATGTYKEVEITFIDKKHLYLSYQEHTDYSKVIQYLKKKCAKKMR